MNCPDCECTSCECDVHNDAPTQEEVESCRDWGSPYDYDSKVPLQVQQDMYEAMTGHRM